MGFDARAIKRLQSQGCILPVRRLSHLSRQLRPCWLVG